MEVVNDDEEEEGAEPFLPLKASETFCTLASDSHTCIHRGRRTMMSPCDSLSHRRLLNPFPPHIWCVFL